MKKNFLRIVLSIFIIISIMIILPIISSAASLSISTSKSTVAPGESFTVTVSLSGAAGPISASASNGSGSSTQWLDNSSLTFTCTAGNSGKVTISASGTVGDYTTETDIPVSTSKSVSIVAPATPTPVPVPQEATKAPEAVPVQTAEPAKQTKTDKTELAKPDATPKEKSSNNNLQSLTISSYELNPTFSPENTEYSLTVDPDTESLEVIATPQDSKANIAIEGNTNLQVGENVISVKVVAENESVKIYKITVTKEKKKLRLKELYFNGVSLIPGFDENTFEYNVNLSELNILAIPNIDGSIVEITGDKNLKEGENIITILLKMPDEDEIVKYNIKVNMPKKNDNNSIFIIIIICLSLTTIAPSTYVILNYIKNKNK